MLRRVLCYVSLVIGWILPVSAQISLTDQVLSLEPGLTASVYQQMASPPCLGGPISGGTILCEADWAIGGAQGRMGTGTDAIGNLYQVRTRVTTFEGRNNVLLYDVERLASGSAPQVIATVPSERFRCEYVGPQLCQPCTDPGNLVQNTRLNNLMVDAINGNIWLAVESSLSCGGYTIDNAWGIVKVSGLPTLLDIFLSYQPPSTLTFNVPVRPEGLAGADSFSLFAGDTRTVSNLSLAAPLECTVPAARSPVPGEQLSVPDTLPNPAAGDSRYYLAAVNYQGQRRAGRSAIDAELHGRNVAVLPVCQ